MGLRLQFEGQSLFCEQKIQNQHSALGGHLQDSPGRHLKADLNRVLLARLKSLALIKIIYLHGLSFTGNWWCHNMPEWPNSRSKNSLAFTADLGTCEGSDAGTAHGKLVYGTYEGAAEIECRLLKFSIPGSKKVHNPWLDLERELSRHCSQKEFSLNDGQGWRHLQLPLLRQKVLRTLVTWSLYPFECNLSSKQTVKNLKVCFFWKKQSR